MLTNCQNYIGIYVYIYIYNAQTTQEFSPYVVKEMELHEYTISAVLSVILLLWTEAGKLSTSAWCNISWNIMEFDSILLNSILFHEIFWNLTEFYQIPQLFMKLKEFDGFQ